MTTTTTALLILQQLAFLWNICSINYNTIPLHHVCVFHFNYLILISILIMFVLYDKYHVTLILKVIQGLMKGSKSVDFYNIFCFEKSYLS